MCETPHTVLYALHNMHSCKLTPLCSPLPISEIRAETRCPTKTNKLSSAKTPRIKIACQKGDPETAGGVEESSRHTDTDLSGKVGKPMAKTIIHQVMIK